MDKLGVEVEKTKEALDKEAGDKATCPKCGSALVKDTNVPQCPYCGSEPFEKKEDTP
jgi:rubrerythrin